MHLRFTITSALLLFVALITLLPLSANAESSLSYKEVSFESTDGVVLNGEIIAPDETNEPRPAIIMVSGAGPTTREELKKEAEAFARRGITALVYDKRTEGYSMLDRDFSLLADDVLAGVELLRNQDGVDPNQVGVWGLSEGAWVAPLAASRSADVAFVVVAGAVGMTPLEQQTWAYGEYLHNADVSGSLYKTLQVRGMYLLKGLGLFANADYNGLPVWEKVKQPVLAVWGTLDHEVAPAESSQLIQQALERGGNSHYTIKFLPGVRHNLNNTNNGGFDRIDSVPETYGDVEAKWIKGLASGPPQASAESPPAQERPTQPLPAASWYDTTTLQVVIWVFMLVAFLSYPFSAIVRRLRKRRESPPVAWPARVVAVAGTATVLGFTVYFLFLVITATNIIGPVIFGQPIPWLALMALAGTTIIAAVITASLWWKRRAKVTGMHRARLIVLLAGAIAFIPWAIYWGLLT